MSYVVIIAYNNTDPEVFGPFATEADAAAAMKRIQAGLADHQQDHLDSISTAKMRAA